MKTDKLDKILLATLWLLASVLMTCFWFNTQFGFNLFSGSHWRYLSYMQASQTPIKTSFYISIIISIAIIMIGLYMLIHPRSEKKRIASAQQTQPSPSVQTNTTTQPVTDDNAARPKRLLKTQATSPATTPAAEKAPLTNIYTQPTPHTQTATPTTVSQSMNMPEISEIMEDAGYTLKKSPIIKGTKIPVMAIGSNETVYIGSAGIAPQKLKEALDALQQVFSDTLEDIEINTYGFIIQPTEPDSSNSILTFNDIEEFRKYISEHKNEPVTDPENFEAFSTYISTVIDYIGKI
ncbi:MAG: hypothetical protein UIH99_03680 [Alphaproteobacteria bacterium]|nr:hypothetical protein [Alphaproteobacteria bacterium]